MFQSVISTDEIAMSGRAANAGNQSSETAICFAVKNGRSPARRPSMRKSFTSTSRLDIRHMAASTRTQLSSDRW